jgi:hypothetical protein
VDFVDNQGHVVTLGLRNILLNQSVRIFLHASATAGWTLRFHAEVPVQLWHRLVKSVHKRKLTVASILNIQLLITNLTELSVPEENTTCKYQFEKRMVEG